MSLALLARLIGFGILWLLADLGALPGANLDLFLQLWPLIVVAVAGPAGLNFGWVRIERKPLLGTTR